MTQRVNTKFLLNNHAVRCTQCDKLKYVSTSRFKRNNKHFCNMKCLTAYKKGE